MRKERDEKRQRREPTDQSPGCGAAGIANALRRPAGDGAARASHPGPHDRPRPPASSGVPVRGCAQAASGGGIARGTSVASSRHTRAPSADRLREEAILSNGPLLVCPFFHCPLQNVGFTLFHSSELPSRSGHFVCDLLCNQKTSLDIGVYFLACRLVLQLGV